MFLATKRNITELLERDGIKELHGVQAISWFNAQYDEATIPVTPVIFIEFPEPIDFAQLTKNDKETKLKIILHIVTKAVADQMGNIPDEIIEIHEAIARESLKILEGQRISIGEEFEPARLIHTMTSFYQRYKGYMITFIGFSVDILVK